MLYVLSDYLLELRTLTRNHLAFAISLRDCPTILLQKRPEPGKWNALHCLEHLNRYAFFYLPEINKRLEQSQPKKTSQFKSGWLGNYLAESMLPKPGKRLNKMKTFKSMDPFVDNPGMETLETFIAGQHQILELLDRCAHYDLSSIRTSISITSLIKLKLGDTLRFLIYHNERHLQQAQRALDLAKAGGPV